MKYLQIFTAAIMLFLGLVSGEKYIYTATHTKTFASHKLHGFPTLNEPAKGGVAAGFTVLCACMIFACITIVKEEIDKHKDMKNKLESAYQRMTTLEMNIPKIDQDYEEFKKNKGKSDDEELIQKALQKKAPKNNTKNSIFEEQHIEHGERV
eukprot:403363296